MTKKDYILLAGVLKDAKQGHPAGLPAIQEIVSVLLAKLYQDNPNFDAMRFRAACGFSNDNPNAGVVQAFPNGRFS